MSGKRVAWYFIAFFGLVAVVNAVMITLAIRTHSGTVTDHPYEKGLAYNEIVIAEQKQEALGWRGTIDYKNGILYFVLYDHDKHSVIPEKSTATITRPTQAGMDFTVELNGSETPVAFPAKGQWEVRVDALYRGTHFQQSKRIVIE